MNRRARRPTRPTVPAPTPSTAELAAEAHARLRPEHPAPYAAGGPGRKVLCGWCCPPARPHTPCGLERCECVACRGGMMHGWQAKADGVQAGAPLPEPADAFLASLIEGLS